MARAPKRRTVRHGPSTASGGTMALTRDPSARRASTRGDERSMRSPSGATTFSMRCSMAAVSRTMGTRSRRPPRSTHTRPGPLTMTSVTSGSARIGSSGPSPHTSASTSRTIRACSAGRQQRALARHQLGHPLRQPAPAAARRPAAGRGPGP